MQVVPGIKSNSIIMVSVLPMCVYLLALEQGKKIDGYATKNKFECNVVVATSFVEIECNHCWVG